MTQTPGAAVALAPIPFHKTPISEQDIDAVAQVLRSGWLATGPQTAAFEQEFASHLGVAQTALGKYPDAVTSFRTALARNPSYAPTHQSLATALALLGQFEESVVHYEAALALRPDDADPDHHRCPAGNVHRSSPQSC